MASSPLESMKAPSASGSCKKVETDASKQVTLPGIHPSTPNVQASVGPNKAGRMDGKSQSSCDGSKGLREGNKFHGKQHDMQSLYTPIDLFEDECAFCHSFRTSQLHGPMACYLDGKLVQVDKANESKVIYVHERCLEWAPEVFYNGDRMVNVESVIERGSKLKCARCRLPGAALGCFEAKCQKSYHVPCALRIPECCWDSDNYHLFCPKHANEQLPCEDSNAVMKSDNCFPPTQSRSSTEPEEIKADQQINDLEMDTHLRKSFVLLGLDLSRLEKDTLQQFASLIGATVTEKWSENVTHVIIPTIGSSECFNRHEVLMAIVTGKCVLTTEWITASLEEGHPVKEDSYEAKESRTSFGSVVVNKDMNGSLEPMKGGMRAAQEALKLFAGYSFILSKYIDPTKRERLKDLIVAADGKILEGNDLQPMPNKSECLQKAYFIYDGDPPEDCSSGFLLQAFKEAAESNHYVDCGAQRSSLKRVFNAIKSYNAHFLNHDLHH